MRNHRAAFAERHMIYAPPESRSYYLVEDHDKRKFILILAVITWMSPILKIRDPNAQYNPHRRLEPVLDPRVPKRAIEAELKAGYGKDRRMMSSLTRNR